MSYQPVKALRFKVALTRALAHLGASPSDSKQYGGVLQTRFGAMHFDVLDTMFCARFEEPARAAGEINRGQLDAMSGKWAWHVRRADDPEDAREVFLALSRLLPPVAEGRFAIDLPEQAPAHSNTRITYMYRDGANYKTANSVVVAGTMTAEQAHALLRCLDDEDGFIPGQIGLPDLQDSFQGCESYWDPQMDHPFHEITCIEQTTEKPDSLDEQTGQALTAHDLVDRFCHVILEGGWNGDYLPAFQPQMAQRYERVTREAASA